MKSKNILIKTSIKLNFMLRDSKKEVPLQLDSCAAWILCVYLILSPGKTVAQVNNV